MALVDKDFGPGYLKQLWEDIKSFSQAPIIPEGMELEVGKTKFKTTLERTPALHEQLRKYARERALYEQRNCRLCHLLPTLTALCSI